MVDLSGMDIETKASLFIDKLGILTTLQEVPESEMEL